MSESAAERGWLRRRVREILAVIVDDVASAREARETDRSNPSADGSS